MASSDQSENSYVIDIEEAAETARLIEQERLFTKEVGSLFPEEPDLSQSKTVLDIGCGPGGWALEVAFTYPHLNVVGIDINPTMIKYAFAQARVQNLENVSFEVMDARQPLEFPDNSFDLVNARFIVGFMDRSTWPTLLAECMRILRPGGRIRLTEPEVIISNSAALDQLEGYIYQTFFKQGRTFSASGRSFGITHMFPTFLRNAGFTQFGKQPFFVDGSYDTKSYRNSAENFEIMFTLVKPYLIHAGMVGDEEFTKLYADLQRDLRDPSYVCVTYGLTAWGIKPA